MRQIGCVAVAVAMATLNIGVVGGATYTWVGGDSGAFSSSSNWQDEGGQAGVPNAGDTAKFTKAVTLTAETVTLQTGTLTLDVGANVTANVTFTGTGSLAKTGAKELLMNVSSSYSGGTTISQGVIQVKKGDSLGSGLVTVDRTTAVAYLYVNAYVTVANDIHCVGATSVSVQTTGSHLYGNGDVTFSGKITSQDCDVWIYNMWSGRKYIELSGTIEIPGHKLRLVSNATNGGYKLCGTCHATIERSQLTNGDPVLIIAADIDYPSDGTLTLNSGNLSFTENGVFGGSKIVLQGSSTGLSFIRNSNVRDDVDVEMGAGMTVAMDESDVRIGSLKVGETVCADGRYSVETNPELVAGIGRVCVNMPILTSQWIGGATGAWYDPANWLEGLLPCDGGIAIFPNAAVTITGDDKPIDIGETGLTVKNAKTLVIQEEITGNGRLAKYGVGILELQKLATYKGGTLFTGGQFYYNAGEQNWNNGTFVIDRSVASDDTFLQVRSATHGTFPFDIDIRGPAHKDSLFYINNNTRLTGKISSEEGGFGFFNVWTGAADLMTKLDAELSAPGQTVTFSCNSATFSAGYRLTGKFNASVVKNDKAPIQFEAPAVGPDETYTGTGGTNIFATTAEWAGTNLTFTAQYGYATALRLTHSKNLSPDATLNLKSGAKLLVDKGVRAHIAHLVIDGQPWPEGKYRASTCSSIAGEGSLVVGPKLGLTVIIR